MRHPLARAAGWTAASLIGLGLLASLMGIAGYLAWYILAEVWLFVWLAAELGIYIAILLVALVVLRRRDRGDQERPTWAPPARWLVAAFLAVLAVGEAAALASSEAAAIVFLGGAALPPLAALAIALRRLRSPVGWPTLIVAMLVGSLLSTNLAIVLEIALPGLVALVVLPVRDAVDELLRSESLEELFYSRGMLIVFIGTAIVAPLAEELTKPLALLFLRRSVHSRQAAFLVGMAGGAGFAILENMFYEGLWSAPWWAATTALRGFGGALHPLGAGLVALGIYGVMQHERGAWRRLGAYYGVAVSMHAAWNGGLVILGSALGDYLFETEEWEFDVFGVGLPGVLITFLVLLSVLVWRLLFVVTGWLREEQPAGARVPLIRLDQPRSLALVATTLLAVALAVGALWGPLLTEHIEVVLGQA
jgi:RsiW-degrading membrane proteinase PrsW (M82 family)